jgi:hypothetical protein
MADNMKDGAAVFSVRVASAPAFSGGGGGGGFVASGGSDLGGGGGVFFSGSEGISTSAK